MPKIELEISEKVKKLIKKGFGWQIKWISHEYNRKPSYYKVVRVNIVGVTLHNYKNEAVFTTPQNNRYDFNCWHTDYFYLTKRDAQAECKRKNNA